MFPWLVLAWCWAGAGVATITHGGNVLGMKDEGGAGVGRLPQFGLRYCDEEIIYRDGY